MSKPQLIAQPKQSTPHPERAETVGDFILWDEVFPALGLRNRFGRESWIVQRRTRYDPCAETAFSAFMLAAMVLFWL